MLTSIISLISGVGAFMIGFKIMSDSISKSANKGLKKLFKKRTNNAAVGVGIGVAVTVLIQSSSATTVMVVGFVNAGVMNLFQATSIIMGANIGTTVTAQIVSLKSFDVGTYAMLLTFIGIFMNLLFKKDRIKTIGYALAGTGLIFLGLEFMSQSMKGIKDSQAVMDMLTSISNPFLLLLFGALATAIAQSSSTITTIIITLVAAGIGIGNGGNSVLYVILGTNIGTCVTALISSIGGTPNAKRASIIHLLFNVFGSAIFMIMLLLWPSFMEDTFASWFKMPATQIAMFHTFFNVFSALIFIPFIRVFVKVANTVIKDSKVKEFDRPIFFDDRMLATPSIAIDQVGREIEYMMSEAMRTLNLSLYDFFEKEETKFSEVEKINEKLEDMSHETIGYLVKLSSKNITFNDEQIISNYHHNLGDIIRIGELGDNITKYTRTAIKHDLEFTDGVKIDIEKMMREINNMYKKVKEVFINSNYDLYDEISLMEENVDRMRKELIKAHLERLNKGTCQAKSSNVFINLVNNLERAADHLTYIIEQNK